MRSVRLKCRKEKGSDGSHPNSVRLCVSRVNPLPAFVPNLCILSLFLVTDICPTIFSKRSKDFQLACTFLSRTVLNKHINSEALGV